MADHARTHRWLAVAAAVLALLALVAGDPSGVRRTAASRHDVTFVTAIDVARVIRDGSGATRLVDLRADSLFVAYRVPGAERVDLDEAAQKAWSAGDTIIIYAEDDARAVEAAARLQRQGVRPVRVLRGGVVAWVDQIVQPRLARLQATATPEEQKARREHLELSRYFGGTPYVSPDAGERENKASEAAAVARIMRRGC